MAVLDKKLKVIKNGVTEEITLYSTTQEVAPDYISAGVGYAKLGSISDPNASKIRIQKKNNNVYAILKSTSSIEDGETIEVLGVKEKEKNFIIPSGCNIIKIIAELDIGGITKEKTIRVSQGKEYKIRKTNTSFYLYKVDTMRNLKETLPFPRKEYLIIVNVSNNTNPDFALT